MGRPLRYTSADVVYHVLNRANARRTLFEGDGDYAAFERVLGQVCARVSMRLLAYCVMPNHWHLILGWSRWCAVAVGVRGRRWPRNPRNEPC